MPRVLTSLLLLTAAACGPSEECRSYVACQEVVDDSVDTTPWQDGGQCWDFPRTAEVCTQQCIEALKALREATAPNTPDVCGEADDG